MSGVLASYITKSPGNPILYLEPCRSRPFLIPSLPSYLLRDPVFLDLIGSVEVAFRSHGHGGVKLMIRLRMPKKHSEISRKGKKGWSKSPKM